MITLASDFGSPYPAAMRGVICSRSDARLVDISHSLPRQDVEAAAFWLREVVPYFPPATHCVVVDPGVGTERAAIAVAAGDHWFVAPDNGVVVPVARELGGEAFEVWEIEYDEEPQSNTFHGRDVFAPAAADVHDAGGAADVERCHRAGSCVDLEFPDSDVQGRAALGDVLVIDDFGNVISNIPGDAIAEPDEIRVNGEVAPVRYSYAACAPDERLVTVGSHGNVEFAVNRGRGDEAFDLAVGDEILLEW